MQFPLPNSERVFVSYNHGDGSVASAVKSSLEEAGVPVVMDNVDMRPGEDIKEFVRRAITSSTCTLCIVSERSLVSGWVAQESILALCVRALWAERLFMAGYLDDAFLDHRFRLAATNSVEARLAELNASMKDHIDHGIDLSDLFSEHTRLTGLKHQLGTVLEYLRGSLCLDLRPPERAASLRRIVEEFRRRKRLAPVDHDVIELREEIRSLIARDECMAAMKRLLDLVRNFAKDQRLVDTASRLHGDLHSVTNEKRTISFTAYRRMRNEIVDEALDMMNRVVADAYGAAHG